MPWQALGLAVRYRRAGCLAPVGWGTLVHDLWHAVAALDGR